MTHRKTSLVRKAGKETVIAAGLQNGSGPGEFIKSYKDNTGE